MIYMWKQLCYLRPDAIVIYNTWMFSLVFVQYAVVCLLFTCAR